MHHSLTGLWFTILHNIRSSLMLIMDNGVALYETDQLSSARKSSSHSQNLFPFTSTSTLILLSHLWHFLFTFPMHAFLIAPLRSSCAASLILLDFLTLMIYGEDNKLWTFVLCTFRPLVTSSFLVQIFSSSGLKQYYFFWDTKFRVCIK